MSSLAWSRLMGYTLQAGVNRLFGRPVTYQRVGLDPFTMVAVSDVIPRLESVDRGKFYAVQMRLSDFDSSPLHSSVKAPFTSPPRNGDTITFDGVTYLFQTIFTDTIPNQVSRGANYLEAAQNLTAAINADPVWAGLTFASATVAHPTCTATTAAGVVTVSYKTAGPAGDLILASDGAYGVTVSAKQFGGGGPINGDVVTLDGLPYYVTDIGYDGEGGVQLRLELKTL